MSNWDEADAIDWTKLTSVEIQISPQKIVDPRPVDIRWLMQPDGSKVLQFGRCWQRGWNEGGIEWVDVPNVEAA
jgi:hypothetical protein